jgi:hypothetical protein
VDWIAEVVPVQGAAAPTSTLVFSSSVNGGAYTPRMSITSAGTVTFPTGNLSMTVGSVTAANNVQFGTNSAIQRANGNRVISGGTPVITSGFSTGSPSIAGMDSLFSVTIGATPGVTGLVTFGVAFTNLPKTFCTNNTTGVFLPSIATTANVTINGVWVANDVIGCAAIGS